MIFADAIHNIKMFCRRYGYALGILLLVAFKLWLVHTEEIYGSATEYDALWYLGAAKHWYWGSLYSWTAFMRPPAYPLFIAFVHLWPIPFRVAIELAQMTGYLALVTGFRKAGAPSLICVLGYAAMVLHPASFQLNNYTMTDSYYAAILPLALGGLLLTLFTHRLIHAIWTGVALAVLWNTREESFLIPLLLIIFFAIALWQRRSVTKSWKEAVRFWWKPGGTMLATLGLLLLAVGIANYRAFHSFSKSEMTSAPFSAAYKALLRIKPSRVQRYVPVSNEALEMAYKVSPAFARLKPQFEGELGHNWRVPLTTSIGVQEIGGAWFVWAFRSAANSQGIHETAVSANHFYRRVAKEINRACDKGEVPSRLVLSSFLDPGAIANARYTPQSLLSMAGLFVRPHHKIIEREDAILLPWERALYDEMIRHRASYRRVSLDSNELVYVPGGWSGTMENVIGSYYPFLVICLSVAGLAAGLMTVFRFRQFRVGDPLVAALFLLAATILLRMILFAFLHATWWANDFERYLFPVMPLYSCFLILFIYQTFVVWRGSIPTHSAATIPEL